MTNSPSSDQSALLAEKLMRTLRDAEFLNEIYPHMFSSGVDEGSLHAYMLSALVLVGDRLEFAPVSDAPVSDRLDKMLIGEGAKRPDAIWFTRGRQEIECLVEFERYTSRSLLPKARNLLIMGKELQPSPHLVILIYWTYTPIPTSALQPTQAVFAEGFSHPSGIRFHCFACPSLVIETLVDDQNGRVRIRQFTPRLYVQNGENKPYIIKRLNAI